MCVSLTYKQNLCGYTVPGSKCELYQLYPSKLLLSSDLVSHLGLDPGFG